MSAARKRLAPIGFAAICLTVSASVYAQGQARQTLFFDPLALIFMSSATAGYEYRLGMGLAFRPALGYTHTMSPIWDWRGDDSRWMLRMQVMQQLNSGTNHRRYKPGYLRRERRVALHAGLFYRIWHTRTRWNVDGYVPDRSEEFPFEHYGAPSLNVSFNHGERFQTSVDIMYGVVVVKDGETFPDLRGPRLKVWDSVQEKYVKPPLFHPNVSIQFGMRLKGKSQEKKRRG